MCLSGPVIDRIEIRQNIVKEVGSTATLLML